ncbi:3-oxoadipate enol-lactonase [Xanthomonas hortorum pv. vitians]|uniref:3-oxoadipate enol-lactonase n=1 Tax=Xanthomonas hortorum pv. vitians TaxID=83224 RepID=A0A6V7BIU8_9XANT|nr:3-oxoadipate enol-lactonase [Xanthomonas hortorum]APP86413.1 3-oxoadipate enol-lactonase [Xanthomonas hortorum pv. gardneri]ASW47580.1 3-oxoadipate enol-lactonase [Xanthomonas hortorum]MCC8494057.1 3-oxoadipate enol-lactonase [Xanthomonas hortorum pv. gardneri]MCE4291010.1 3-oxoadipate enol-lactonase [Xanthomonas hortorum pv. vitians]MCE4295559.1 3-oxoadipate enol-lactonase [Xanthomonas hortorum pv. vitians]
MAYLQLPTHRLHYRLDGTEGRPWLTFCNSLGTDLQMWDTQIAAFAPHYRILRYDRRGHGDSDTPPGPYSVADLGQDVLALWDALQIDQSDFCGVSIGGLTGQWLGLHAPQRLRRLVVCATAQKIGSSESWNARIAQVRSEGLAVLVDTTLQRWFTPPFAISHAQRLEMIVAAFVGTSPDGYIACCQAVADADFRGALDTLALPLLAVAGEDDPVCTPNDLREIASAAPHGHYAQVPGRHICNLESPAAFNDTVLRFLQAD